MHGFKEHRKSGPTVLQKLDTVKEFTCLYKGTQCYRAFLFAYYSNYNYKIEVLKAQTFIHNLGQSPHWRTKSKLKATANSII